MAHTVMTVSGELVEIVDTVMEDGSRPRESSVLTAADGRKFRPSVSGLRVMEITEEQAEEIEAEEEAAAPAEEPEVSDPEEGEETD